MIDLTQLTFIDYTFILCDIMLFIALLIMLYQFTQKNISMMLGKKH